jgi:hypothetical protein
MAIKRLLHLGSCHPGTVCLTKIEHGPSSFALSQRLAGDLGAESLGPLVRFARPPISSTSWRDELRPPNQGFHLFDAPIRVNRDARDSTWNANRNAALAKAGPKPELSRQREFALHMV